MTVVEGNELGDSVEDFYRTLRPLLSAVDLAKHRDALDLLLLTYEVDGVVFSAGNGGSATTASHLICDLTKTARPERGRALRGVVLTDQALITAYANDVAYQEIFSAQLTAAGRPGDCLVVISASGRSPNILNALSAAQDIGMRSIALLGEGGSPAGSAADVALTVSHADPGIVETVHMAVLHSLTAALRRRLGAEVAFSCPG